LFSDILVYCEAKGESSDEGLPQYSHGATLYLKHVIGVEPLETKNLVIQIHESQQLQDSKQDDEPDWFMSCASQEDRDTWTEKLKERVPK